MDRTHGLLHKKVLFILPILLLLFMASCRESPPTPLDSPTSVPIVLPPSSLTPLTPTLATYPPITSLSPTPLTLVSRTSSPPSPTPLTLVSLTPTPAFLLCSPLAWETIPELWEIISDPYNPPPPGRDERHQGVDFSHYSRKGYKTIEGEPVQAVLSGIVAAAIQDRLPYGNMVMIETSFSSLPAELSDTLGMAESESIYLLYAHFGHIPLVDLRDQVQCGQVIGDVGLTGYNIVNPHLHLEARLGPAGSTFDSIAFYTASATEQEMKNYKRWRTSGEFRHFDPMKLFEFITRTAHPTQSPTPNSS